MTKTCEYITIKLIHTFIVSLPVPLCPTSLPSLQLVNCLPYPGQSCEFECLEGFKRIVEVNVTCDLLGQWNPEWETLCSG